MYPDPSYPETALPRSGLKTRRLLHTAVECLSTKCLEGMYPLMTSFLQLTLGWLSFLRCQILRVYPMWWVTLWRRIALITRELCSCKTWRLVGLTGFAPVMESGNIFTHLTPTHPHHPTLTHLQNPLTYTTTSHTTMLKDFSVFFIYLLNFNFS